METIRRPHATNGTHGWQLVRERQREVSLMPYAPSAGSITDPGDSSVVAEEDTKKARSDVELTGRTVCFLSTVPANIKGQLRSLLLQRGANVPYTRTSQKADYIVANDVFAEQVRQFPPLLEPDKTVPVGSDQEQLRGFDGTAVSARDWIKSLSGVNSNQPVTRFAPAVL